MKLVRESNHRYNLSTKKASSPDDVVRITNAALDLSNEAAEEIYSNIIDREHQIELADPVEDEYSWLRKDG